MVAAVVVCTRVIVMPSGRQIGPTDARSSPAQVADPADGYTSPMLWTVFIILGIIAFVLIILGRRRV